MLFRSRPHGFCPARRAAARDAGGPAPASRGVAAEVSQDSAAVAAYYEQFPAGRERAAWPGIVYVRVRTDWGPVTETPAGLDYAVLRT